MSLKDWIGVSRDVFQIIFFITAIVTAIWGIRKWRAELEGKTQYEVAKSVIAGAYRIRDEIKRCRAPMMSPNEYADREAIPGENDRQKKIAESMFAYNNRYRRVIDALNEWYPAVIEAEALFGAEARENIEKLQACCRELGAAISIHHQSRYENWNTERFDKYSRIIYGVDLASTEVRKRLNPSLEIDYDDDGFQENLEASLQGIQEFFSKYIRL